MSSTAVSEAKRVGWEEEEREKGDTGLPPLPPSSLSLTASPSPRGVWRMRGVEDMGPSNGVESVNSGREERLLLPPPSPLLVSRGDASEGEESG